MLDRNESKILLFLSEQENWVNLSHLRKQTEFGQNAISSAIKTLTRYHLLDERRGMNNAREFLINAKGKDVTMAVKLLVKKLEK